MPQASEQDRAKMIERFGDIGPNGPIRFLEERGFRLLATYEWVFPNREFSEDEHDCLNFLADEWDF